MAASVVNGVRLYWEQQGESGAPIVFVHGSWGDHHNWDLVVPSFARTARVFTYDRRGHSQSERPPAAGRIQEDVDDLAALIRTLGIAPAHVVGNSGGAVVSLKLAAAHPDVMASLVVHEPPLFGLIPDHPLMPEVGRRIGAVQERLRAHQFDEGAKLFVETIAFGPGMWDQLTAEMRQTFIFNAPTFLDELSEPMDSALWVDLDAVSRFGRPVLLTQGDTSAPFFATALDRVAQALPAARRYTFPGAGHVPHLTAPDDFARVVGDFVRSVAVSVP